jgi:molybdopterin molybdotransferase
VAQPLITITEARDIVLAVAAHRLGEEDVEVEQALDRVLATDVVAAGDVPPFPCSAMDGYAILDGPAGRRLTVHGESRAGSPHEGSLQAETAIRISTGAAVPRDATAVIRQEDVVEHAGAIETTVATPSGANIRYAGEDMRAGALVLTAGTRLTPGGLGAAVAAGAGRVRVARRPRVAVMCTGDELRAPGEPLRPGEIHNSNGPMLTALAARCGALAGSATRLPDDRAVTEAALADALERADVVVVSGGVSVGPHDHVKPALAGLGVQERFWGVALQPGKPTWFGSLGDTLVFGLPGNPVSAVVTFTLFARPALAALQGETPGPAAGGAVLGQAVRRNPSRDQAIRVRLELHPDRTVAIPTGAQDSHLVTSLLGADALAIIPAGEGELAAGADVTLERIVS